MKNTELRALIREQVKALLKEANEMSFINKARAKSSLEQIKKGKRSDGMGKFDAKVYAIKGTQEIELKDPSDLAKYSTGYKYGLKSESKITEAVNIQNDEAAIKALEDVAANWTSSNKAHFLELLNQVIDYFHKTKLGESKINEEITLNSPLFKNLVTKVQEISDKSGNDWDALKTYLKGKYARFDTYTTGPVPAAYVVNFFAITKGQDEYAKKNPKDYIQIGDWYITPW